MGEFEVAEELEVVGLVVRGIVPVAIVYGGQSPVLHLPELGAGIGVADPAAELASALAGHQFDAPGPASGADKLVLKLGVHCERGSGLVVETVPGVLPIALQREVQHSVPHGPVESSGTLEAELRPETGIAQLPAVHR